MKKFKVGDIISFPSVEEMKTKHVNTVIEKYSDKKIIKDIYQINCCVNEKIDAIILTDNPKKQLK